MSDGLERLKVLINSSTPIVVMETSEEMRAVNLVRTACSELNMATFEWSIADGLVRSGSGIPAENPKSAEHSLPSQGWSRVNASGLARPHTVLSPSSGEADRLTRAVMSSMGSESAVAAALPIDCRADEVRVMVGDGRTWSTRERVRLQ